MSAAQWRPGTKVAQRIANALLRASRAGHLPDAYPAWADTTCVMAVTHTRLTPGTRAQLGRLWRQYGSAAMAEGEAPAVREVMETALRLSA
jgi:hypothetical protein